MNLIILESFGAIENNTDGFSLQDLELAASRQTKRIPIKIMFTEYHPSKKRYDLLYLFGKVIKKFVVENWL